MADIILSPLVNALIENLVFVATYEIKMLSGVEEDVDRLCNTLSSIGAVLEDSEEKQVTSRAINNWLRKLKDVAYDADDIVDEFAIEVLRAKLEGSIHERSKRKQGVGGDTTGQRCVLIVAGQRNVTNEACADY